MALVQEYLRLTETWKQELGEKTLVLYQVGSFYEVYGLMTSATGVYSGSNIAEFAALNELVIAPKLGGKVPHVMAGVGVPYVEKYIRRMQEHDYTLVIYKQDPAVPSIRTMAEIVSPGTYFGEEATQLSNHIMCIWLYRQSFGVAAVDIFTGKTTMYEGALIAGSTAYDAVERT